MSMLENGSAFKSSIVKFLAVPSGLITSKTLGSETTTGVGGDARAQPPSAPIRKQIRMRVRKKESGVISPHVRNDARE